MLDALNNSALQVCDALVGWLLYLPTDAALAILALGTGAILTFVRPFTTDQEMLKRCRADKSRLAELARKAKRAGDRSALKRHRATQGLIAMKQARAELKPLLVAIIPVAMLAVWAFARLEFLPAQPGETLTVNAWFSASAIGGVTHVVPQEGLASESGWIQRIVEDPRRAADGRVNGLATWKLKAAEREKPYALEIRFAGRTYPATLQADGRRYAPPYQLPGGDVLGVEIALRPYKPFGFIPGIPWVAFAPWLVGYLVMTVPFVFALRRLCRIC